MCPAYIPRVCTIACAGKRRTVAAAMKTCEGPELRVASVVGGDNSSKVSWPGRVLVALGYPTGKSCMITCMCSSDTIRQQLQSNAYYTLVATLFAVCGLSQHITSKNQLKLHCCVPLTVSTSGSCLCAVVSHDVDLAKLQGVVTGQSQHHDPTPILVVIDKMKVVNSPASHKQLLELFQVTMVCLQATSAH